MSLSQKFPPGSTVINNSKKYTIIGISVKNTAYLDAMDEHGVQYELHNCFCVPNDTDTVFKTIKQLVNILDGEVKPTNGSEFSKALVNAKTALETLSKFY